MIKIRLFVYGTLKRGYKNYLPCNMDQADFIGVDSVKGQLYSVNGLYPVMTEGNNLVQGEVFDVPLNIFTEIACMELQFNYVLKEVETSSNKVVLFEANEELAKYIRKNIETTYTPIEEWIEERNTI